MILMPQIFDVIANENARYKRNELEWQFTGIWRYTYMFISFSILCHTNKGGRSTPTRECH